MPDTTATPDEVAYLVMTAERFKFLLEIMVQSTGVPAAEIVRDLDEMRTVTQATEELIAAQETAAALTQLTDDGRNAGRQVRGSVQYLLAKRRHVTKDRIMMHAPIFPPSYRGAEMETFTIYYDPLDFPGRYVVRRFRIAGGEPLPDPEPVIVTSSLHTARNSIPDHCDAFLTRSPADHPSVVETWL